MAELHVAVLAAGRATRFGGDKLEAPCAGKPLGRWVLDAVIDAGLKPGTIVIGPQGVSFAEGWQPLVNTAPKAGIGSSLALAARAVLERGDSALLVLLADMPLVTPGYLRELVAAPAPASTRHPDGHPGVPALLDRVLLGRAAELTGDHGAGPLLDGVNLLEPPPGMLRDVDTPEDLAEVERQLSAR